MYICGLAVHEGILSAVQYYTLLIDPEHRLFTLGYGRQTWLSWHNILPMNDVILQVSSADSRCPSVLFSVQLELTRCTTNTRASL